ncbi:MAG: dicarboxylate/amino acid:cation symporter [Flavobacteriaceae bacterium]|jgi:Na+/H+-dicarboxylate symporter|nr:dicarboxylate/amino acid:cation symporter [Flavobacteriaceae bacterium]
MKLLKKSLLLKIVIAILLGAFLNKIIPNSLEGLLDTIGRLSMTFNGLFNNFLSFAIPLIILGLIVPAIGNIGKEAGKLLLITTAIAYGSTIFAGLISYGISEVTFPYIITPENIAKQEIQGDEFVPYFQVAMPPIIDVMSALILSFIVGIGISRNNLSYLDGVFKDFEKIVTIVINKIIIPFLPLLIFGIFLNMAHSGKVYVILNTFIKIIGVIFFIHILVLLLQFSIAGTIAKKNPFKLMYNMLPAYFTALGTQSSAATIPVTLKQTLKNGVNPKIANFTIPLCATIHLSGSTLKIVSCSLALIMLHGETISTLQMIGFICMLGITMVAAPGVPGGAIMASLGVLASILGFSEEQQNLMIALYIAMDSFGTACNVMGDGAISVVVNKLNKVEV